MSHTVIRVTDYLISVIRVIDSLFFQETHLRTNPTITTSQHPIIRVIGIANIIAVITIVVIPTVAKCCYCGAKCFMGVFQR
jgi:homoserine dehydrogenase